MNAMRIFQISACLFVAVSTSLILVMAVLALANAVNFQVLTDRVIGAGAEATVIDGRECEALLETQEKNECVLKGILQNIQNQDSSFNEGEAEKVTLLSQDIVRKEFREPVFFTIVALIFVSSVIAQFSLASNLFFSAEFSSALGAWAIDSPPVLGICGTLYSLIQYLESLGGSSDTSGFLEAFSFAAVTTLLGAAVSVVNHFFISVSSLK